jgi:hypothetical protein
MSSHALKTFTDMPGSFSDGVSQTNSTWPCDPFLPDEDELDRSGESTCWVRFPVCEHSGGMQAFFDVCLPSDGKAFSLSEPEMYRLLCHVLVQRLPDKAFEEAIESLSELHQFHTASVIPSQSLPASRGIPGQVGATYVRPVFPVTDEE